MSFPRESGPGPATHLTYRIRIVGALGDEWSGRVYGMSIEVHGSGPCFTELVGKLPDEAALMGLLDTLYNHGAHLLSVEQLESQESSASANSE